MKILNKMQRRAATWILGAFKMSPLEGIKALAGLMPIRFHLQKVSKRSLIRPFKLPTNHILKNLLNDDPPFVKSSNTHNIGSLSNRQKSLFKGHLHDAHSKSLGIFPSFSPIDPEFSPGNRIVDTFSNRFSFNLVNKKVKNYNKIRGQELDKMVLRLSSDSQAALVVTDASIKNDIATSISPSYPTKLSWDYCKKIDCDDSLNLWKMTFQASDGKGRNFLDLLDDDFNPIEPHYKKGGPWLQAFGHSNSLCAHAVRAITNCDSFLAWIFRVHVPTIL